MEEEWKDLPDYPQYRVSSYGRVASDKTGQVLSLNFNQQGIPSAAMFIEGKLYRKSVQVLVAEAFLPPPQFSHYDTPTHLDGDKGNNHAENLIWRPRWFAMQYHKQFYDVAPSIHNMPVEIVSTGEIFDHAIDLCMKYGVLLMDVFRAVNDEHNNNNTLSFVWFEVRFPPSRYLNRQT